MKQWNPTGKDMEHLKRVGALALIVTVGCAAPQALEEFAIDHHVRCCRSEELRGLR